MAQSDPKYFDENNQLCRSQSGFRNKHSTKTAVIHFADQILMGMDKGLVTGAVFIDLRSWPKPVGCLHVCFSEMCFSPFPHTMLGHRKTN